MFDSNTVTGCCAQVNTKPGARRGKKAGKKKKDEAAEAEDLDDDEQTQHDQEIEDAAGQCRTYTWNMYCCIACLFYLLTSLSLSVDFP